MRLAAIALGLMAAAGPGWAENSQGFYFDGQALFDACKSNMSLASGYVAGVFDRSSIAAIYTDAAEVQVCSPASSKTPQLTDVACKYLGEHPAERHYSAAFIVAKALQEAFPCP